MDKKPLWNDDKTNGAFWGGGLVAVALLIGGSYWPGWQLDSSAEKMAVERAQVATVVALAPICVDRYAANATPLQRVTFGKKSSWERGTEIATQGFATFKGAEVYKSEVADKCASVIGDELEKAKEVKKG